MLPTPACQRMAPQIIDNLTRLRQMLQHWGEFQPHSSQHHFRLGIHYALEPFILPRLAKTLAEFAPNVTFASIKVDRENLTRGLAAGHIDMAFDVALPIKPPVLHTKLIDDEFCVMMRKGHPLEYNLTRTTYFTAKHIGVSNRPNGAGAEDISFQQQGLARQISIRCQNYYAAKTMLIESDFLLTVPYLLGKELMGDMGQANWLSQVPMPVRLTNIETHLYWHKNTEHDEALSWFRQVLVSLI
jgi:DNA-binding transcriptional LysR family regulator